MRSFLSAVRAPSLCITATHGWPWAAGLMLGRITALRHVEHHHLVGGHHIHLDAGTAAPVVDVLMDFLRRHQTGIDEHISTQHAAVRTAEHAAPSRNAASASRIPSEVATALESRHANDARMPEMDNTAAILSRILPAPASESTAHDDATMMSTQRRRASASPIWTDRHVFIAQSLSLQEAGVPAVHVSSDGVQHIHVLHNVMKPVRVAADYAPRVPLAPVVIPHPVHPELVWATLPSSVAGFDVRAFHRWGFHSSRFGAWVPRVFIETMPTLEAALGLPPT